MTIGIGIMKEANYFFKLKDKKYFKHFELNFRKSQCSYEDSIRCQIMFVVAILKCSFQEKQRSALLFSYILHCTIFACREFLAVYGQRDVNRMFHERKVNMKNMFAKKKGKACGENERQTK